MKASGDQATILARFAEGPTHLGNAIRGLSESGLDLASSQGGWSIREIVHHLVDGDGIWMFGVKMALGNEQAEFHLDWYSTFPQTHWSSSWAYAQRSVGPSLELLSAIRRHILDVMARRPDGWDRSVIDRIHAIREERGA